MQPGYILNRGRVLKYILKVPLSKLHIHITAIEDAFKLCADALFAPTDVAIQPP